MSKTDLRVWVGCLGCYNAGWLFGEWFDPSDAPGDGEELAKRVAGIPTEHLEEEHEEVWVFDHEGFGGVLKGEVSPAHAAELAELIEDLDDDDRDALAEYMSHNGITEPDHEAVQGFRDAYRQRWDSERDYAMH